MTLDPLVVDTYAGDGYGGDAIQKLVLAGPPWHGLILKATEGTYYPANRPDDREWFLDNWMRARVYAGTRYGQDWFRGAYHYHRIDEDPVLQAESFLKLVEEAGGWGDGDLWPMIDVEQAENPQGPGAQKIVDSVQGWVMKVAAETGRQPMLYGAGYLWENSVTSHMGCGTLCFPRYTPTLPPDTYHRIGWQLSSSRPTLWAWQLAGDGECHVEGYPSTTPMGRCDYSAVIVSGGGDNAIAWTRANLAG